MATVNEIIQEVHRAAAQETPDSVIVQRVGVFGSTGLLTQRYTVTSSAAGKFYNGPAFGIEIENNNVPIIYGRVLVAGQGIDGGETRDDLDPTTIQKVLKLRLGEGPIGGIVGDTPEEQLQNTFVNCVPITNKDGTANIGDIALASVAGTALPYLMNEIADAVIGKTDPVTGLPVNDGGLSNPNKTGMRVVDLADVVSTSNCKDMILVSDGECKWVAKHFNQALIDSGMTADGGGALENVGGGSRVYKITENGVAKLRTLVAGTGVTVQEQGDTIVISAGSDPLNDMYCRTAVCVDQGKLYKDSSSSFTWTVKDGGTTLGTYTGPLSSLNIDTPTHTMTHSNNRILIDRKVVGDRCSGFSYAPCPSAPTVEVANAKSGGSDVVGTSCSDCGPTPTQTPKPKIVQSPDGGAATPYTAVAGSHTAARYDHIEKAGTKTFGANVNGGLSTTTDNGQTWTPVTGVPYGVDRIFTGA